MAQKVVTVRRNPNMTDEEYVEAKREATKGMTIVHITVAPGLVSGSTTFTLEKPKKKPKKAEEPPEEPPEEEVPEEEPEEEPEEDAAPPHILMPEEEPEEEEPPEEYTESELMAMTRVQLNDIATSKGLNWKDYANKAKIAEAIRA